MPLRLLDIDSHTPTHTHRICIYDIYMHMCMYVYSFVCMNIDIHLYISPSEYFIHVQCWAASEFLFQSVFFFLKVAGSLLPSCSHEVKSTSSVTHARRLSVSLFLPPMNLVLPQPPCSSQICSRTAGPMINILKFEITIS